MRKSGRKVLLYLKWLSKREHIEIIPTTCIGLTLLPTTSERPHKQFFGVKALHFIWLRIWLHRKLWEKWLKNSNPLFEVLFSWTDVGAQEASFLWKLLFQKFVVNPPSPPPLVFGDERIDWGVYSNMLGQVRKAIKSSKNKALGSTIHL